MITSTRERERVLLPGKYCYITSKTDLDTVALEVPPKVAWDTVERLLVRYLIIGGPVFLEEVWKCLACTLL